MALQIKDIGEVPPERWQFKIEQTGFTQIAPNWPALYPAILKHCRANNVPEPSLQEVVNWCCKNLSIACFESETHEPLMNNWARGIMGVPPAGCCGSK